MRGPGPKWRAKHERTLRLGPVIDIVREAINRMAQLHEGRSVLMLGIGLFVIALLFISPTKSKADTSYCAQVSDLAPARLRWAVARQSRRRQRGNARCERI
jgi:hypothetical protein